MLTSFAFFYIWKGDYRQDGNELLICCTVDGDIRGFSAAGHEHKGSLMDSNVEQDLFREFNQKKQVWTKGSEYNFISLDMLLHFLF